MKKECSKCKKEVDYPNGFSEYKVSPDGVSFRRKTCRECIRKNNQNWRLRTNVIKRKFGEPIEDLVGKKYGRLTVIKDLGMRQCGRSRLRFWLCLCDCGKETEVRECFIKTGKTKSCGCLRSRKGKDNPKYAGYKGITGLKWRTIKNNGSRRNLEFSITVEFIWNLFLTQDKKCVLTGEVLSIKDASLDRIDSSKGYTEDNVQWVHKDLNIMKMAHSQEYFIELCKKVVEHNVGKDKESQKL